MMKTIKFRVGAFLLGLLLGVNVTGVFAGGAYGIWGYYGPQLGYSYKNRNYVYTDTVSKMAQATVWAANAGSGDIPAGYMGVQARLYKDGNLLKSSTIYYNPSATATYGTLISDPSPSTGAYYSCGLTFAYNGSGYYTYSSYQSPNQNY